MQRRKYFPIILHSRLVKACDVDAYHIELLTDVKCGGTIQCPHILIAFRKGETEPCYAIASEAGTTPYFRTYYLGGYPGDGHVNYGSDDEFGDLEIFQTKAIELMEKALGISIKFKEQKSQPDE